MVTEVLGAQKVTGVRLRDIVTDAPREMPVDGLFIAIGHAPNTALFRGSLEMDATGYLVTRDNTRTSVPGVFVAGDVQDPHYRQAVTAAGAGCKAAIDAGAFLTAQG